MRMLKAWSYSVKRWRCCLVEVNVCCVWKWEAMAALQMLHFGMEVGCVWTVPFSGCIYIYLPGRPSALHYASF